MWEIQAYQIVRQPDGSWLGRDKLDAAMRNGWEPFAVTEAKDNFYGLLYHVRKFVSSAS